MKVVISCVMVCGLLLMMNFSTIASIDRPLSKEINIYRQESLITQQSKALAQLDIKVKNGISWVDDNMHTTMNPIAANPTISIPACHYYWIQIENDGPDPANATVSVFWNGSQFFIGLLMYTKWDGSTDMLASSGFSAPYSIDTDYIEYLLPGDTTNVGLLVFGQDIAGFAGASEPWNPGNMDLVRI